MKIFKKIFKKESAQSLVEVIVAISLISIVFTGSWQILHDSFMSIHQELTATKAYYLVVEDIEAIRSIRDEDWNMITDGTWHISYDSGNGIVNLVAGTEDVGAFSRRIEISSVRRNTDTGKITEDPTWDFDPNTKLIEVIVQWYYQESLRTDMESIYLTNWARF